MQESRRNINVHGLIAAALAVVLQIVLAPAMTIGHAVPNFVAVYVLCATLCNASDRPVILAFVLGFIFDFIGSGPVGAMAFCLVLATALAAGVFRNMSNGTWLTAIIVIVASCLVIELLYGIIVVIASPIEGFGSALINRILPCALYDCVIGAIAYPVISRLTSRPSSSSTDSIPIIG